MSHVTQTGQPSRSELVETLIKTMADMALTAPGEPTSANEEKANRNSNIAYFPIPRRGHDIHFGLSRYAYLELERRGLLRLRRLRLPGNVRGRLLVPYAEVYALIERLGNKGGRHE